ncbi:hypothetical protein [Mucilaginibacter sp. SJ]|uniref:hypothetical protein n=1 Tax=Mucilaginibacter sp. SJ TaxID=3029053 RepID=UPI0023A9D349|nr:hypothetical protein [Mucilaginibacter sp. SJ]WDZ99764.1 hypothetical protein MusilaSJ_20100 [Mucilaginibacter sp. SJ]
MKKATVLEALKSFGDEVDIEKLIEKLLVADHKNEVFYNADFVIKIEKSQEQVRNGEINITDIDNL